LIMHDPDTDIRRGASTFPSTHWSIVAGARDPASPDARRSLERLIESYWRPIYLYVRTVWKSTNEDAKDLTQDFLSDLLEGRRLDGYEPERGRFRAYLKGALRHFLVDRSRGEHRIKRGGDRLRIPWETAVLEATESAADPERLFDRAWGQSLLDRALEEVRLSLVSGDREIAWRAFDLYELQGCDSEKTSYGEVARRLGIPEQEVKSHLAYVRALAREAVRRHAAETVASEQDLSLELKELFG